MNARVNLRQIADHLDRTPPLPESPAKARWRAALLRDAVAHCKLPYDHEVAELIHIAASVIFGRAAWRYVGQVEWSDTEPPALPSRPIELGVLP